MYKLLFILILVLYSINCELAIGQTIEDAVDNTTLSWSTWYSGHGGGNTWSGQSVVSYYGGDAAESGNINDDESNGLYLNP